MIKNKVKPYMYIFPIRMYTYILEYILIFIIIQKFWVKLNIVINWEMATFDLYSNKYFITQ